jgi:lipopolysaccharide/colanic/teichoic acid biosynthesis glycosyltransferase
MKIKSSNNLEIIFWRSIALILLVLLSPIFLILSFLILIFSGWPVFFVQKRTGCEGKTFNMYKFRTMVNRAEKMKKKLMNKNEANGPVFKIRNDPRLTKIGSFLSHTGLDELPQILNIFKGEMVFIGPRPLPIDEANQIKIIYKKGREKVLPGLISPWILDGYHKINFDSWMKSDLNYVKDKSFKNDCIFFIKGVLLLIKLFKSEVVK